MLLMIDNYDSFTYNLVQYFGELGEDVRVARNDQITLDEIAAMNPDRICVSPGPCSPAEAGISVPVIEAFAGTSVDAAKYYDFDDAFLIEKEPHVLHFEVNGIT